MLVHYRRSSGYFGDSRPIFLSEGKKANKERNKAEDGRPNRISKALIEEIVNELATGGLSEWCRHTCICVVFCDAS
ncbi:MAG: hypothetical protein JO151_02485 [Verrucomicrobia bacterium]|nr:hypothetical protein [Verrucomicrobiota bacterium]